MKLRASSQICVAAIAAALATQSVAADKKPEFERKPFTGAYEPQGVDERGLWMEMDEAERGFRDSPQILHDERLKTYLSGVLCKTVGFDRCGAARIYVVKDHRFNASMAPNGLMIVNTGLLARMHSEAELSTVLGHEFGHFELRHSLNRFRALRKGTDWLAWLGMAGAATGNDMTATQNAIIFGFFSYNREQEKDADFLGAAYVRSSPYPLRASAVWKRLAEEDDATREERKLRKIKRATPGATDTHPTGAQRFAYFSQLEAEPGAQNGEDGREQFREETSRILPDIFAGLVKGNDFAGADYVIRSRGDALGWDGQLLHTRAELYRLRGNPRDLITARQFYEKAITLPGAPPETWRGIGLTAMRTGDTENGKVALKEYLAKAPTANDSAAIKMLLEN